METRAPRTSIVILNYNGRPWLTRCLETVMTEGGDVEVLVVDNASADGSADAVRRSG